MFVARRSLPFVFGDGSPVSVAHAVLKSTALDELDHVAANIAAAAVKNLPYGIDREAVIAAAFRTAAATVDTAA
jgi:hypothetical protein